jgi:hypothetical protein
LGSVNLLERSMEIHERSIRQANITHTCTEWHMPAHRHWEWNGTSIPGKGMVANPHSS